MRENRTHGSEGREANAFLTPIIYTRILILLKIYVELMLNRVVEGEEVRAFVELPEKAKVLMPITRKRLRDQEKSWRLPRKAPGLDLYTFYFK